MSSSKSLSIFIITLILLTPFQSLLPVTGRETMRSTTDDLSRETLPERSNMYTVDTPELISSGKVMLQFDSAESRDQAIPFLEGNGWQILYVFKFIPMITVVEQPYSMQELQGLGVQKVIPSYITTSAQQQNLPKLKSEVVGMTLEDTVIQTNIDKLRELGYLGTDQTWTIIDSGVDENLTSFRDLDNLQRSRVKAFAIQEYLNDPSERTYDKSGHGTHVAGIAAGNGYFRNAKGELEQFQSKGMAPDAEIISIKVLNKYGSGDTASVLEGLEMAISMNSSVISMSFGTQIYEGIEDPHIALIEEAKKRDILMVAAIGNDGAFGGSTLGLPAALPDVLAVGAVTDKFYSNDPYFIPWGGSSRSPGLPPQYGVKPDVLAPGVNVVSVNVSSALPVTRSGTSMAVPHVSGGAVLLRQAFPNATAAEIRYAITAGAKDIYAAAEVQGRGMVDFYRAYQILNGSLETKGEQKTVVTPVSFNDGKDRSYTGRPFRQPNLFYSNSIAGHTKSFNITIFSKENLTLIPKVQYYYGSPVITLPSTVQVTEGVTFIPVDILVNSTELEYNFAEIYFEDAATGNMMEFSNVTFFSQTRFSRGTVLFDLSKDKDTVTGFFSNDGPRGKYLKLASILEDEGFIVKENYATITEELLDDVDVLVIADPELSYNADERTAIRQFVSVDGKGLLMMGNGGFLRAEGIPFAPFNYQTMNSILTFSGEYKSGIQFDLSADPSSMEPSDFRLVAGGNVIRTRKDQSILPKNLAFEFYGPKLTLDYSTATLVADYNGAPVIAASEVGNGRILVFSSNLGFDSFALDIGRYSSSDPEESQEVAIGSFNWLVEKNDFKVSVEVDGIRYSRLEPIEINLYDTVTLVLNTPTKWDGSEIQGLADTGDALIYYLPSAFGDKRVQFTRDPNNPARYLVDVQFNDYGDYVLLLKMDSDEGPIFLKISLFVNLQFFNDQDIFNLTARIIFLTIIASWFIWVRNEGGRKLYKYKIKQKKKKN